jgi:ArsR family transcriptional regulator
MELVRMLKVLGEPMRLKIYQALLERKHCVRSLSRKLGISESAISQHLKVMKEAGLVYGEKYGYHMHYLPSQEAIDFLAEQVAQMQQASRTVDRDSRSCQCEYRKKEG